MHVSCVAMNLRDCCIALNVHTHKREEKLVASRKKPSISLYKDRSSAQGNHHKNILHICSILQYNYVYKVLLGALKTGDVISELADPAMHIVADLTLKKLLWINEL